MDSHKVLAGFSDDEDLADDGGCIITKIDDADDIVQIQMLPYFPLIQHIADIAALVLVTSGISIAISLKTDPCSCRVLLTQTYGKGKTPPTLYASFMLII